VESNARDPKGQPASGFSFGDRIFKALSVLP
jgi:hypothetical protein